MGSTTTISPCTFISYDGNADEHSYTYTNMTMPNILNLNGYEGKKCMCLFGFLHSPK